MARAPAVAQQHAHCRHPPSALPDLLQIEQQTGDQGLWSIGKLIRQSSQSLAGLSRTLELTELSVLGLGAEATDSLWIRGGFRGRH
jgi:hypothetical protein